MTVFRRLRPARADRGNVAVIVALVLPVVLACSAGAAELAFLMSDRSKLQDAVDAAALAGAAQINVSSEPSIISRAEAHAEVLTERMDAHAANTFTAEILRQGGSAVGVKVTALSVRPSFFGNLLPPGGFRTTVSASAMAMSTAPLCVFGVSETHVKGVNLENGKLIAQGCVVHSNKDVFTGAGAINATISQAVGTVGALATNRQEGAAPIPDPFAGQTLYTVNWNNCGDNNAKAVQGNALSLEPGVHCGNITVEENATLRLMPGVHFFKNSLEMKKNGRLVGDFVTLVIGPNMIMKLDNAAIHQNEIPHKSLTDVEATWDLFGAQSGPTAGFALIVDKARNTPFFIPAKVVTRLEGVVYSPSTQLQIYGYDTASDTAAQASAWTVLVGKEIRLSEGANVVMNTNYGASQVPVPAGVGNKAFGSGGQRLAN